MPVSADEFEREVVELTNRERSRYGLAPLKVSASLSHVARMKSYDMRNLNYFDHISPNYGSPYDMMEHYGISYDGAAENIARGQLTPAEVVDEWMNISGHRDNMLGSYTHIGVGYVDEGKLWTQMFITELKPEPRPEPRPEPTPEPTPQPEPIPVPEPEPTPQPIPTPEPEYTQPEPASVSKFEREVFELTNRERRSHGLEPFKLSADLSKVARVKSEDMRDSNYFSHTSPNYGSPFDMMRQFGISFGAAGENIAMGQSTPARVVDGWMNSKGHRENILGNFTHIGVGYADGKNLWTQMFMTKR